MDIGFKTELGIEQIKYLQQALAGHVDSVAFFMSSRKIIYHKKNTVNRIAKCFTVFHIFCDVYSQP